MADYVRFCPKCKLVYKPDNRIYENASIYCPKCGSKLVKDEETEKE